MFFDTFFLRSDEISLFLDETVEGDEKQGMVPAYRFTIHDKDSNAVGVCEFRAGHNRNTFYVGNIGYGIYEEFRGHHYAGKACLLLFELAKKHNMEYVIITCSTDNLPSRKTCEFARGRLDGIFELPEDMQYSEESKKCRYVFKL